MENNEFGEKYLLVKMFEFWFDHNFHYCNPQFKDAKDAVKDKSVVKAFYDEWLDMRYCMDEADVREYIGDLSAIQQKIEDAYDYCLF